MINHEEQKQRASTLLVNVSQARHFTFDFINDTFVSVTRRESYRSTKRNASKSSGVTAIVEENIVANEHTKM